MKQGFFHTIITHRPSGNSYRWSLVYYTELLAYGTAKTHADARKQARTAREEFLATGGDFSTRVNKKSEMPEKKRFGRFRFGSAMGESVADLDAKTVKLS